MNADLKCDILLVDDEPEIRRVVRTLLIDEGYLVREAESGRTALGEIALQTPDLVILDLGLPDRTGAEVLRALRGLSSVPVLILSVFGEERSKVEALDSGADDYLTKPFGGGELLARLRALLRRGRPPASGHFRFGPIEVDLAGRRVTSSGSMVKLTATEYALLQLLVTHRDQVLTHRQILRQLWGPASENQTHYLRIYMMRLRRKLGAEVENAGYFQTESGVGYRFVSEPVNPAA